jgi:Protein of unknown function (DUF3619)
MTNATYLQREAQMDRFGLKVASQLDDLPLPHDISERLRIARQQALAQRKVAVAPQLLKAGSVSLSGSAAALGGGDASGSDWFSRILGTVPLIALAIGLIAINVYSNNDRANELAEVDTQLLIDDLPPSAHTDAGFAQFLKFGPPVINSASGLGSGQ